MKKLPLLIVMVAILFCTERSNGNSSTNSTSVDTSFVGQHGQLSVSGTSLVDKNGDAIVLRGVSFGWHNWWPRFYTAQTLTWLVADWKVNMVRAAIGVEPQGAYIDNAQLGQKCLDTVVNAAIRNGIYVIVDWHSHNIRLEEAKAFFTRVAEKYKDYPNIIYEIFNEPLDTISWAKVKAYSIEIIKTIRAIDSKNIILVGNPHWSQDVHLPAADPIVGYDNLMYTLHFYAATHKQWLRDRADAALKKGLPLFVSECTATEASGNGGIDEQEWAKWLQWMQQHNISWTAWSISDKNETCSMIENPFAPLSGWEEVDLKEWGKMIRNELRKQ